MSQPQQQCKCCSSLLSLGVTVVFLWLAYRPIVPRYYLVSFSLASSPPPARDNTTTLISSSYSYYYELQIENKCWEMGVYHDDISLSLSPSPSGGNLTSSIPSFYQGHKKTADKSGSFFARGTTANVGVNVTNASSASALQFRVGLESGYRYKVWGWKTSHRGVSLGCQVEVDGSGKKTAEKGIRLTSSAAAATTTTKKKSMMTTSLLSLGVVVVFILY
ncbi:putative proline-rich receptor-like protein kinase PERK13 [Iris pallida]|uniref:Proline-rich receptor-like protein kinase PERK13 n=1 Tax=Iris pallida TaxID=29817 RepID=A0AAX6FU56_IRIPA|nr:putative proline-rich receptor-like protein kinase PERK13 [Iris pallida]